jgi:hypothetical protein
MSVVSDIAEELETALNTVPGVAVYRDPGATLATPALVLGPPALIWESGCLGPTEARFLVYVIVDANERAVEALWDLLVLVGDAIDSTDAVVLRADPATYVSGTEFPAYECLLEVRLG